MPYNKKPVVAINIFRYFQTFMESRNLLLLTCILAEEETNEFENLRYMYLLDHEGRRRRMMRIPRISLQDSGYSSFSVLFSSGCDQSLITITGFDHKPFRFLLKLFFPMYDKYTPHSPDGYIRLLKKDKKGRPRSMNAEKALGLALSWFRTRGSLMGLCMMFGVTASVCSLFIRFSHKILLKILENHDLSKVKMPFQNLFTEFNSSIIQEYPLLENVYCFMDGVKFELEKAG